MSTLPSYKLSPIQERDVDLLVVEELTSHDEFADWFIARTWGPAKVGALHGARHSVNDSSLGESDVVFVFTASDSKRYAILVENKIDTQAQPDQAERYRQRGERGQTAGDWIDHRTCIIAPESYLTSERSVGYDYQVSYEEIRAFLHCRRSRDKRFLHKSTVFDNAIEKSKRSAARIVSPGVSLFFKQYFDFAEAKAPALGARDSGERALGNTWMVFQPTTYPSGVSLVHQASGFVKLFFDAQSEQLLEISRTLGPYLDSSMRLGPAGKSVSVAIAVPSITPSTDSFSSVVGRIEEALDALTRLDATYCTAYKDVLSDGTR